MREGQRVKIVGHSKDLWIVDFNCYVDSEATIAYTPFPRDKKVGVIIDNFDGSSNVFVRVKRDKIVET